MCVCWFICACIDIDFDIYAFVCEFVYMYSMYIIIRQPLKHSLLCCFVLFFFIKKGRVLTQCLLAQKCTKNRKLFIDCFRYHLLYHYHCQLFVINYYHHHHYQYHQQHTRKHMNQTKSVQCMYLKT